MRWIRRIVAALALTATVAQAQVVLNFDDLTFNNYDPISTISANYGANLDPHLSSINYRTFDFSNNVTYENHVELWHTDYGDLTNVVFPSANGYTGEIMFVPAAGYGIQLISFDIAGWPNVDRTNTIMRLVDGSGALLYDFASGGPVTIEGNFTGSRHSSFTPNFFYAGTLGIQWGVDWNVGIDNIQFQLVAIPEPSAVALGLGLAGVAMSLGRSRCRRAYRLSENR